MFRDFVPQKVRPWIYVVFAFCFQLSGGLYLGALNEIVSGQALMREDVLMGLYCNLAAMAVYFPLLFRFKFRFPNKVLLLSASLGLVVCSFGAAYAPNLPTLWAFCVLSGFCKLQGTFECISNIQLWMTPKRDFRVFFPLLHIFIMGAMQVSDFIAANIAYLWGWQNMHWLMAGVYMTIALILMLLTKIFYIMPPVPLRGTDWIGGILWLAWLLQMAFFFDYGETRDWFHYKPLCYLAVSIVVTFTLAVVRSYLVEKPFLGHEIWHVKRYVPALIIILLAEFFLASEHVLEEVFYEEGLSYSNMTTAALDLWSFTGVIVGCLFSLVWLKVFGRDTYRLATLGLFVLAAYMIVCYSTFDADFDPRSFTLPILLRAFASAVVSISLMNFVNNIMTFQTFFMALSVFNMIHMLIGGVMGAAFYSHQLNALMADYLSRYSEFFDHISLSQSHVGFDQQMHLTERSLMIMSIKTLYGWAAYACIASGLVMLLYKVPILRKSYRRMKTWQKYGKQMVSKMKD